MSPKYIAGPINSLLKARFIPHMGNRDPCNRQHSQGLEADKRVKSCGVICLFLENRLQASIACRWELLQFAQLGSYVHLRDCEDSVYISLIPLFGLDHLGWGVIVRDVQPQACTKEPSGGVCCTLGSYNSTNK